jgi:hypothetical protein
MLEYAFAACVLACPLAMLAMLWLMRGHRGRDGKE